MTTLTAADFADTGQWRLLLFIGGRGLTAYLENTIHPEIELQKLCEEKWPQDESMLCKHIEEAVYNNPRLLDDFATKIVIDAPQTIFMPSVLAQQSIGAEENAFLKVYDAAEEDIMTDQDRDITAIWSPGTGVKCFLMRTFPGARITCQLMDKIRNMRKDNRGLSCYVFPRELATEFILLKDSSLLSASSQEIIGKDKIKNFLSKLLDAYEIDERDINIEFRN